MFGLSFKDEVLLERPQPVKSRVMSSAPAEYEAVCTELGFTPTKLLEERALIEFQAFCDENSIPLYNLQAVEAYLEQQVRKTKKKFKGDYIIFTWEALRKQDHHYFKDHPGSAVAYNKKVPIEALKTALTVAKHYPEARFYVSDIKHYPDPFLAVVLPNIAEKQIIAVWDEPVYTNAG